MSQGSELSRATEGILAIAESAANQDLIVSKEKQRSREFFPLMAEVGKKTMKIKLRVENAEYIPSNVIGQDGNRFFCQECSNPGEIVCCDGCPNVYHPSCVPLHSASRISLDNDDDPWYCPVCMENRSLERFSAFKRNGHRGPDFKATAEQGTATVGTTTVTPLANQLRKRTLKNPVSNGVTKKRKSLLSEDQDDLLPPGKHVSPSLPRNKLGPVQTTPAFYLFLDENRTKIERALARRVRKFSSLPKGPERYGLIAKEAATWWVKLRPVDHRRFVNMSIREFESKIIEWKERKGLNLSTEEEDEDEFSSEEQSSEDNETRVPEENVPDSEESRLRTERHRQLFSNTSVGSRVIKMEPDQNYNTVLMDLLHDSRFHSIPMITSERQKQDRLSDDEAKTMVPCLDVHGPYATSIGDECLGCSRGWLHYCPVSRRQLPFVDDRSKFQPPLTVNSASRIGLGLRPRLQSEKVPKDSRLVRGTDASVSDQELLPVISGTLDDPSQRVDDVVKFYEEVVSMKIPDPERAPTTSQQKPTDDGEQTALRCGRCRNWVDTELGCIECRRAQLVINLSRGDSDTKVSGHIKPNTRILTAIKPRLQLRASWARNLNEDDQELAKRMVREQWMQTSILSPEVESDSDTVGSGEELSSQSEAAEMSPSTMLTEQRSHPRTCSPKEVRIYSPFIEDKRAGDGSLHESEIDNNGWSDTQTEEMLSEIEHRVVAIAASGVFHAVRRRDPMNSLVNLPERSISPSTMDSLLDLIQSRYYRSFALFKEDISALHEFWKKAAVSPAQELSIERIGLSLPGMMDRAEQWVNQAKESFTSFLKARGSGLVDVHADANAVIREFFSKGEKGKMFSPLLTSMDGFDSLFRELEYIEKASNDFLRTEENEEAYYGSLAIHRAASASEKVLAHYPDSSGRHSVVCFRGSANDEDLQGLVEETVKSINPSRSNDLSRVPSWREEGLVRLLRTVQTRRVENRMLPKSDCVRCEPLPPDFDSKQEMKLFYEASGRVKFTEETKGFVDSSREHLTTGLGSQKTRELIEKREDYDFEQARATLKDVKVSVRSSKIHGMGLFADQPFQAGHVIAEYVGEYIANDVWSTREANYSAQQTQIYHFRLNCNSVIDATKKGGYARYINHCCEPNAYVKIEEPTDSHGRPRAFFVALQPIGINEEITYDYDIPIENDLSARFPCRCGEENCRGFMNWRLPERGVKVKGNLTQKKGSNMRDRIRRLNRPLKRYESV